MTADDRSPKKPALYWATLATMAIAFLSVVASAHDNLAGSSDLTVTAAKQEHVS
jgi:hypothetical protein